MNEQQSESLDEARDMMKRKPMKQPGQQNGRDLTRMYFYEHFNKWLEESVAGLPGKESYSHYRAIVDMGRSAVPFLYELAKNDDYLMNDALEEIYGCRFQKDDEYTDDINEMHHRYKALKAAWLNKMEQEGDI